MGLNQLQINYYKNYDIRPNEILTKKEEDFLTSNFYSLPKIYKSKRTKNSCRSTKTCIYRNSKSQ